MCTCLENLKKSRPAYSRAGWEELYTRLAPPVALKVLDCSKCRAKLVGIETQHLLDFWCWEWRGSDSKEYRSACAVVLRRGTLELQLLIEVCAWVWLQLCYIPVNDRTPPAATKGRDTLLV